MKRAMKNTKGFTLVEVMVVLAIGLTIAALGALAIPKGMVVYKNYMLSEQIKEVQQGAMSWAGTAGLYTGISMSALDTDDMVTDELGDGAAKNPFSGNITVTVGSDAYSFVVSATGVPPENGKRMQKKYGNSASYDAATKVLTVTTSG